jgi:hypothetical protein
MFGAVFRNDRFRVFTSDQSRKVATGSPWLRHFLVPPQAPGVTPRTRAVLATATRRFPWEIVERKADG